MCVFRQEQIQHSCVPRSGYSFNRQKWRFDSCSYESFHNAQASALIDVWEIIHISQKGHFLPTKYLSISKQMSALKSWAFLSNCGIIACVLFIHFPKGYSNDSIYCLNEGLPASSYNYSYFGESTVL